MCTETGNHTAPQYNKFRKTNDARIKFGTIRELKVSLPNEDFSYGRKNRPQTPVGGIIAHEYSSKARD